MSSAEPKSAPIFTTPNYSDGPKTGEEQLSSSPPLVNGRRGSDADEWDASKVPPSRFQKRKGSLFSTPGSRDGHVDRSLSDRYHQKLVEKGYIQDKK